jgi:asparaginyl-tRNA synthetase
MENIVEPNPKVALKRQIINIINDYKEWVTTNTQQDYAKDEKICGWVRDFRSQSENAFISLYDGSTSELLQVVCTKSSISNFDTLENVRGACIEVFGSVIKSPAKGQLIELLAKNINIIGNVDDKKSILLVKNVPVDTLRAYQHLRPRFRTFSYIYKIRSTLLKNIHIFFHSNNFYNIDPNIITTSDCEGAGEVFTITTLDARSISKNEVNSHKDDDIYKTDFFEKQAFLTVSSQLQLEALAAGLSRVYTLNPSFRAEKSKTKRHLACFTHLEWEIAFIDINDLMNFSEGLIKYVIGKTLKDCEGEYIELDKFTSKGIIEKLSGFINCEFERISYDNALILIHENKKQILKKFAKEITIKDIPNWGDDLGSYCERYISEDIYKKPTFVYNYPRQLKSFYMKINSDGKTVQGVDLLIPGLGELIGSSIREENYEKLCNEMDRRGMDKTKLEWFIDLRRNSTFEHGGAGLGFDRLVNMCTLMDGNIRDVVPFPVAFQECDY